MQSRSFPRRKTSRVKRSQGNGNSATVPEAARNGSRPPLSLVGTTVATVRAECTVHRSHLRLCHARSLDAPERVGQRLLKELLSSDAEQPTHHAAFEVARPAIEFHVHV